MSSYRLPPEQDFDAEFEEPLLQRSRRRSRSASVEDFRPIRKSNSSNNNSSGYLSGSHSEVASCSLGGNYVDPNDHRSSQRPLMMVKRGRLIRDFSIQEDEDQDPYTTTSPNIRLQPYQKQVYKPVVSEHTSIQSNINHEANYDTPNYNSTPTKHRSRFSLAQNSFDSDYRRKSLSKDSAIQCDSSDPPSRNGNHPRRLAKLADLGRSQTVEVGHSSLLNSSSCNKKKAWQKSRQLSFDLGSTIVKENDDPNHSPKVTTIQQQTDILSHIDEDELTERIFEKLKERIKKEKSSISYDSSDSDMDVPRCQNKFSWKELIFGHRIRKWMFWSVVAFLSALTLKDVYDLVTEYKEDPKQADMKIVFNKSIEMPNITFCMSRAHAWSHFRINTSEAVEEWDESIRAKLARLPTRTLFLTSKWDYRMVIEAYEVISTLTSIERETSLNGLIRSINRYRIKKTLSTKRKMIKFWVSEITKRDISFEELIQKVGTETLDKSIRKFERLVNETEKVATHLKISWLSTMQLCFQPSFDRENIKPIEDQGNFFSMVLEHNVDKLEGQQVDCMSIDFHGRPSSLSRFMEGEGRIRDGYNDELCLGMMHDVKVEIRARYIMLENDDVGTSCRNNEASTSSEFNCRSNCRLKLLREICNCTALSLSYLATRQELQKYPLCDYENCFASLNGANFSETNCSKNCYPECNQIRYDIEHQIKGRSVKAALTTVDLKWGSFEYGLARQQTKRPR